MPPILETHHLTRLVGTETLVEDVSVSINLGEVFVIIGSSGAGKSSFLRLLNRLDEPTEGTVIIDGVDYRELPPRDLRVRVGLVPQDPALISGTVFENATRGLALRNRPIDESQVQRILSDLDLGGYEARDVGDLSGGEKQRVALARTLLNGPEIVLLDEPTASLDTTSEAHVEDVLAGLGGTVVLVTHDVEQARRIGDRVMELCDGRVIRVGPPEEVLS